MIDTEPVKETKFGFGQLGTPTPMWAKITFRIFAIVTTVAVFIVATDPGIPDHIKVRISVYLKGADMLVLGLSQMFGESHVND